MARTARIVEIPSLGALDRAAGDLSRQLAQALRDAVRRGDARPGLVLGFGGFDRARMEAAAQRLAEVVGGAAGHHSSEESGRRTQQKVVRGQQT